MKKKFLSALVCSTLFVSVMPNVFAETDADKTEVIAPIQIGEYMQMGSYYGEPILWRCVAYEKVTGVDEENGYSITDSTDTVTEYEDSYLPLMVSDKIICIKAFDANSSANSANGLHSRDLYEQRKHGSNYWATAICVRGSIPMRRQEMLSGSAVTRRARKILSLDITLTRTKPVF